MDRRVGKIVYMLFLACSVATLSGYASQSVAAPAKPNKNKNKNKPKGKPKNKPKKPPKPADAGLEAAPTDGASEDPLATEAAVYKKNELLVHAGLLPSPLVGFGGGFNRYTSETLALGGFITSASGKIDPIAVSTMTAGFQVKKVFGKIPYVTGGLGYRMSSANWFTFSADQTTDLTSSATANALTIDLGVGAQFRLGSFHLGADLIGISYPVVKLGVKNEVPTEAYDEQDYADQKAKFDKIGTSMTTNIFKLGIGFAF